MRLMFAITISALLLSGCLEEVYDGAGFMKDWSYRQYIKDKAASGDANYQYRAGKLFCCGERPEYDNVEALRWFCEAAKNGQRDAMFEVGKMYETASKYKGEIIPKDDVQAYVFYTLAVQHDSSDAVTYRDKLAEKLTIEQIGKAGVLLERWPAIHCKHTRD